MLLQPRRVAARAAAERIAEENNWRVGEESRRRKGAIGCQTAVPTGPRDTFPRVRDTSELAAADRRHLWHPFTQQQSWSEEELPLIVDHAEGTNLYDSEGNAYIDGVSSLWCNVHGHRHPAIDAADPGPAGFTGSLIVAQFASRMGSTAVEYAVKLLNGEQIPTFTPVAIELVK